MIAMQMADKNLLKTVIRHLVPEKLLLRTLATVNQKVVIINL
jgi:hypothetical protein